MSDVSYTERVRFSSSSSPSSSSSAAHKRRKSTGIMKTNTSSNIAANQAPSLNGSPAKKKRRNVSFGGAHVRVFDKANATASIQPSTHIQTTAEEEENENEEQQEVTMDFTRSFNAPIITVAASASLIPPVDLSTVNESALDLTAEPAQEEVAMDFTRSFVFDIIQSSAAEVTADLPSYDKMSEKTKAMAEMFKGILAQKGEDEEEEQEEEAAGEDEEDDEITFKETKNNTTQEDVTMDFTRSFTSQILTTQPSSSSAASSSSSTTSATAAAVEEEEDMDQSAAQEECTMDFTRSFTAAIITNPPVASTAGFLSPLRFPPSSSAAAAATAAPTPVAAIAVAEKQNEMDERSNEVNADELTMEFTRSFTTCIERVSKRASLLPNIQTAAAAPATSTAVAQPTPVLRRQSIVPAPVAVVAPIVPATPKLAVVAAAPAVAPIAAPAAVAAPAPAATASPSSSVVWPPTSVQSWLECYFIDAFDMEDAQAACLHLIDATSSIQELVQKMEQWICTNEKQVQALQYIKQFPQGQVITQQIKSGVIPAAFMENIIQGAGSSAPKLATLCNAIQQFYQRLSIESHIVWNEWKYKLSELSYQRLLDAQQLIAKDAKTLVAQMTELETKKKTIAAMMNEPETKGMKDDLVSQAKKLLSLVREFEGLKFSERRVASNQENAEQNLMRHVLLKGQELCLVASERELENMQHLLGFAPKFISAKGMKLVFQSKNPEASAYELEMSWNAAGEISATPTLTPVSPSSSSSFAANSADASFYSTVYREAVEPALHSVLGALKHRKQVALVLPHITHLLERMHTTREEINELRRKYTVSTSAGSAANDEVEVTISRVDTLAQVIVRFHYSSLLNSYRRSAPVAPSITIVSPPSLGRLNSSKYTVHSDLTVDAVATAIAQCQREGWGKTRKMCETIQQLIGPIERA